MRIFLRRDAAARAVGADRVAAALVDEACKQNLDIEIVRTGARGLFWLEPMIEVETPEGRVGLGPVSMRDVAALVIGRFERDHPLCVGRPEDIPFLKP